MLIVRVNSPEGDALAAAITAAAATVNPVLGGAVGGQVLKQIGVYALDEYLRDGRAKRRSLQCKLWRWYRTTYLPNNRKAQHNTRLERTRHPRASLPSCLGEPLQRSGSRLGHFFFWR